MNFKKLTSIFIIVITFFSCNDDKKTTQSPLVNGTTITLRNTLTDGFPETPYPQLPLFVDGLSEGDFDEEATLSNTSIEFATALKQDNVNFSPVPGTVPPFIVNISGLYKIDFTENSISFELLPEESDSFWGPAVFNEGPYASGKFDRYYFTLSKAHNIKGFTSNNPAVNLRLDSDTSFVVELGEGYEIKPGLSFTVNLN